MTFEPIRMEGIIENEVTAPTMNGSSGCALYKVPIQLSAEPPGMWKKLFENCWNSPPAFNTGHRPGIARVVARKIILDGTTLEEVRDRHLKTLRLCVDRANEQTAQFLQEQSETNAAEAARKAAHKTHVSDIVKEIDFDE